MRLDGFRALLGLLLCCAVLARGSEGRAACVVDDTDTEVCLEAPPARVVSLYGAFTELLWEIGAGGSIVARTKDDTTVPAVAQLPSVGTGLRPDVELLLALRPDLVVSRGSRAAQEALGALRERSLKVAAFDPSSLDGLYSTAERLGLLTGRGEETRRLAEGIRGQIAGVASRAAAATRRLRVAYEVRADPLTVAGSGGLIDDLIRAAGGINALGTDKKLVALDVEALLRLDPDAYVVQKGPMNRNPAPPSERPHLSLLRAVREGRVLFVDEQLFARPGPRVGEAAELLSRFLYPDLWASGSR